MFTYDHYKDTCKKYMNSQYTFCTLDMPVNINKKQVYMVHDVDFDLDNAIELSKIESENNIVSTYFIRIGAKQYNIFNSSTQSKIKEILMHGNKIGFHYERVFEELSVEEDLKKCKDIFKTILNIPILYFNIHEPARTGIDISNLLQNNNRCYNSNFFKNIKYISDSGSRWREGCFSNHINKHNNILVLTHPIWWYKNKPSNCF